MANRKILVGFDGSEPATRAAKKAADLAQELGWSVQLVCVVPPVWLPTADFTGTVYAQLRETQLQRGRQVLSEGERPLKALGVPVETVLREGPPADELAQLLQAAEVDLLVVGATSTNLLTRVFVGSVVYRLLHLAKKPVLVVP